MADMKLSFAIHPGKGLGWMSLGNSLHGIVSQLKSQPHLYPLLDLTYSASDPVQDPIVLTLPANGIRLRFDGPDQRLRLIEIIDFSKTLFTYGKILVVNLDRPPVAPDGQREPLSTPVSGPSFRHVYNRLIGPTYAGEYLPPLEPTSSTGTYILSYPGLAIRFPVKHKAYKAHAESDFVSLLSSSAGPATSIAIFSAVNWSRARDTLYTDSPPNPRSIALSGKNTETVPDEIEHVVVLSAGRLELHRRSSPPFFLDLNRTTPQDIVAELGPPDAIHRKNSSRLSIHAASSLPQDVRAVSTSPSFHPSSVESNRSSSSRRSFASGAHSGTDSDVASPSSDAGGLDTGEMFYNYFNHGFDILISPPSQASVVVAAAASPAFPGTDVHPAANDTNAVLVATKFFLHSNIPGSHSFNRYRRSRWSIAMPPTSTTRPGRQSNTITTNPGDTTSTPSSEITSEDRFTTIAAALSSIWPPDQIDPGQSETRTSEFKPERDPIPGLQASTPAPHAESQRGKGSVRIKGMVLNRGYDSSPDSSVELLGELEESTATASITRAAVTAEVGVGHDATTTTAAAAATAKNTEVQPQPAADGVSGNTLLYGFPGMLFEVMKGDLVVCLTIY